MGNKTALITGASRGIGRAIALALADSGFSVILNYARDKAGAETVLGEIQANGGEGTLVQADIRSASDRYRLVAESLQYGGRIDVLVNNAGVAPKVRTDILEATEESFDEVLATNLKGPYFLTQQVAKAMVNELGKCRAESSNALGSDASKYEPRIINITSVSAYAASSQRGEYCISKAGAAMMTTLFAMRLAEYGVGVYEIRPGIIATDMTSAVKGKYDALFAQGLTPLARWGQPEDVAKAVQAIATGAFPYSTGQVINVDGGFHLREL